MTLEEKQAKLNDMVSHILKAKAIMNEFNNEEGCENILAFDVDRWDKVCQIHITGYGEYNEPEIVDVVKLDKTCVLDNGYTEHFTEHNGVKIFALA